MKKILLSILFLLISSQAWATTWYVRVNGGTKSQCTGTTNADYPGSGSGQACAYLSPMYVLGAGCGNYGGSCDVAGVMSNGDTLDIEGDNGSNQAQYPIGYDSSGVITPSNSSNCNASGGLNCTMGNPPSGTGSSNMTTIQTTPGSTHKAQLYGILGVNQVLNVDNNYVLTNNLEITQHSACIFGFPGGGTVDGFPKACVANSGNWAKEGVFYGGSNSEMENMWIHGIAHDGTDSDNLSNFTSLNNTISGNAFNGDAPGNIYSGSSVSLNNVTWQNDIIVYNGCGQHYPMHSSDPYDTANYHDCYDDNNSGQGDGLGNQAGNAVCTGNLNFINDDVSFNTQDGLDFLHCEADGNFYMYRTRTEGNEGQQVKFNGSNAYIENSLIVGDCYYFANQSFTYTGGSFGDFCRAGGEAINTVFNGGTYSFENSTVLATGPGIQDAGASAQCSGTLNWYNDNVIGGYNTPQYGNNALATWIDHECTSGSVTFNEDYNHVWNTANQSQCGSSPGTHDKCGDSSAATTTSLTTSMIGPTAYYQSNDLGHLLYASSGGQLPANANNAISLTGTSNDFNNYSRGSSWTIGGYQINSCVSSGGTCFESGECCNSASCTSNICGGSSCFSNGTGCSTNSNCCSNLCSAGSCVSCVLTGNSCINNSDCCTNDCNAGTCSVPSGVSSGAYSRIISGKCLISGKTQ